jgi:dimethylhistidine N-methyltransferase
VNPVIADFAQPVRLAPWLSAGARLGFFPGSTIGNLKPASAVELLKTMRRTLGRKGRLIIGADLQKDEKRLLAAYDDQAGITAAFNRNVLAHANRALGTSFDPESFEHLATYDRARGRIDMHLVSSRPQSVRVFGRDIQFLKGERIHTEHSHKYTIDGFQNLARKAGWKPVKVWTDREALFSVHELRGQ